MLPKCAAQLVNIDAVKSMSLKRVRGALVRTPTDVLYGKTYTMFVVAAAFVQRLDLVASRDQQIIQSIRGQNEGVSFGPLISGVISDR
jgi:hypothetical protein